MSDAKITLTATDATGPAFEAVKKSLESLKTTGEQVKQVVEGMGAAFAVERMVEFVHQAIEGAAALGDLSQRTGMSTESLSQLQFAAKIASVSSETLGVAVKKLQVSMATASAGDQLKISTFKQLGITQADLGKGTEAVMMKMADAYAHAQDGAGKTAVSIELMGRAGDEMIPLLNRGGAAIRDLMKEADSLGLTIGADFAEKATQFEEDLKRMQAGSQKLAILLAGDFVEGLDKAMLAFIRASKEGSKFESTLAGIRTLLTGDDLHKANVTLVEDTEKLLSAQNELDRLKRQGYSEDSIAVVNQRAKISGLQSEIHTTLNYRKELTSQVDAQKEAAESAKKQREEGAKLEAQSKASLAAAQKEAEEYRAIKQAIDQHNVAAQKQLDIGRPLTDSERLQIEIETKMKDAKVKLTDAHRSELQALLNSTVAIMAQIEARELLKKSMAKEAAQLDDLRAERNQGIVDQSKIDAQYAVSADKRKQSLQEANEQLELEASLIGASDTQRQVMLQLLKIEQDRRQKILDITRDVSPSLRAMEIERVNAAAAEEARQATVKADLNDVLSLTQRLQDLGHTLWEDLWSSGHDKLKKIGDDIKKYLVDELYQLVVKQWVFNISANVVGGAATGAVQGASSALFGAGGSSLAGGLGSAFMAGYNGLNAGVTIGAGGAVDSVIGAGGIGAGIESAMAAIPGWGWAALGAAAIASLFSKSGGGPKVEGGSGTGGLASFGDVSTASQAAKTIAAQYANYAAIFGLKPIDVGFQFGKDPQGTALSQLNVTGGSYNRASLYGGTYENVGRSDAEFQDAVAKASAQLVLKNLQDAVSGPVGDFLKGVDITTASLGAMQDALQIAQDVGTFTNAIDAMGPSFAALKNLSIEAAESLVKEAGGVQNLQAELASFYNDFIPEAEKHDAILKSLTKTFADANVVLPTSRDEFAAAVKAAIAAGNTNSLQTLLSTEQAFSQLYPAIDKTAEAAGNAADTVGRGIDDIIRNMQSLDSQTKSLQVEYLRATGDTTGADALQRSLDTAGLSSAEIALYDYNVALRKSIQAVNDAKAAEQEHAQAAAQAAAELAATGQQMIAAQQQQLDAFMQKQSGLQQQIWQLTGNTAAIRQAELDALEPGLRPMQEYIYRLEDQKAAMSASSDSVKTLTTTTNDATNAANELANAWKGATDSVMGEVARIRGLITGSDPAALAVVSSQFAIAKAKAQARDLNAYKSLPALSQQYLSLYEQNATSSSDLRRVQGRTATGLETLAMYLSGSSYAPVSGGSRMLGSASDSAAVVRAVNGMASTQEATSTGTAGLLSRVVSRLEEWAVNGFPGTDPQWNSEAAA
jgi:hypothetical protein